MLFALLKHIEYKKISNKIVYIKENENNTNDENIKITNKTHHKTHNKTHNTYNNNDNNIDIHNYSMPLEYIIEPPISNGYDIRDQIIRNKQQNSLDRIYNPLRYPYKSDPYYDIPLYPNMGIPPQVIGCGGRATPCIGGTQVSIPNIYPPINISNQNIAPVNITTRGPLGQPQQMGVMQKVYGDLNEIYPVYGRRKYPNDNKWEYYTQLGPSNVKVPLITTTPNYNELGTNDVVTVQGNSAKFIVTMYDNDYPQYVPYM